MANDTFFASWALWEQMTFVLGLAIVAVFCAGLIKLSLNNRLLRKQEVLDEEKRARLKEMRRTGLPVKRGNDVPFGVRAIQSGIVVEGIWISRPPSPNLDDSADHASATTLIAFDPDLQRKGKQVAVDSRSMSASTLKHERALSQSQHGLSDGSILQRLAGSDSPESQRLDTRHASKLSTKTRTPTVLKHNTSEDNRTGDANGSHGRPLYETYIPTSATRPPIQASQRSVESLSGDFDSQPWPGSGRSGSRSSSPNSLPFSSRLYDSRTAYSAVPQRSPEKEPRDPFETPLHTPTGMTFSEPSTPLMHSQDLTVPQRTFGSGDSRANKSTRRVYDGFQVQAI